MHFGVRHDVRFRLLLAVAVCVFAAPAHSLVLTLRSGNAAAGNPDPLINRLDLATSCSLGYPTAFAAAEFSAAVSGPPAVVLSFVHPAWLQSLACDPLALWIGTAASADPMSALYAMEFDVPSPCCFTHATLDFCWSGDDALGDAINPAGLYVNQTPIAAAAGGSYATETSVSIDVTSLVHCGRNTLHIYNRDLACAVSGIIFNATLKLDDCTVPATPNAWGNVKALYR